MSTSLANLKILLRLQETQLFNMETGYTPTPPLPHTPAPATTPRSPPSEFTSVEHTHYRSRDKNVNLVYVVGNEMVALADEIFTLEKKSFLYSKFQRKT